MNCNYTKVKCFDMKVDLRYQREPSESRVKKIAKEWRNDLCRQPVLSRRSNGSFYVIDGNHTRLALLRREGRKAQLLCTVYSGLSLNEEADLFNQLNTNSKKPTLGERLKALITSGDKLACEYKQRLEKFGIPLNLTKGGYTGVSCHSELMSLFKKYRDNDCFDKALGIARASWGDNWEFYINEIFCGLIKFVVIYPEIDEDRMITQLSKIPKNTLINLAKQRSFSASSSHDLKAYCISYADIYNKRLRGKSKQLDLDKIIQAFK